MVYLKWICVIEKPRVSHIALCRNWQP